MDLIVEFIDGWWCVVDGDGNVIDGFDEECDAHMYMHHLNREDSCRM